jgi:lipoprotein-releasing system permease protein
MIVSLAFIGGFKHAIREKLFTFWGGVLVTPFDANSTDVSVSIPFRADPRLVEEIKSEPGVRSVYPFVLRPGIIKSKNEMEGIKLKGVTPSQKFPAELSFRGEALQFPDTSYSSDIILSRKTAARLDVKPGETITLYFITDGAPRIRRLKMVGTYHTGMEEVDRQYALCDMRLLQHLGGWQANELSGYQIELNDNSQADSLAEKIYDLYIAPPMDARSIPSAYKGIFSWLSTQDTNGRILLIIVGIVAMINLASTMLILMVDRAVMIGLLKALGMEPRSLWMLFLSLSGLIGGIGILLGNLLGLGLCAIQSRWGLIALSEETYNISQVPVQIHVAPIVLLDVATLALCLLCTLLPLLYIRRIQPARVLQFE